MKLVNHFGLGIALMVGITGCSDPDTAKKALEGAGYSEIKITGYSWLSCGRDDVISTGFEAKGPTGVSVEGAVCSGLFIKNSTIRTE